MENQSEECRTCKYHVVVKLDGGGSIGICSKHVSKTFEKDGEFYETYLVVDDSYSCDMYEAS